MGGEAFGAAAFGLLPAVAHKDGVALQQGFYAATHIVGIGFVFSHVEVEGCHSGVAS